VVPLTVLFKEIEVIADPEQVVCAGTVAVATGIGLTFMMAMAEYSGAQDTG
jgi:hypothetical protein